MMYIMDEEGWRSSGGGMFTNIFRSHGESMGAGINFGINKVGASWQLWVWGGWAFVGLRGPGGEACRLRLVPRLLRQSLGASL